MFDLTGEKVLFFSDTHFGHSKLVSGCENHFENCRNYATTDEMDEDIIKKFNEVVDKDTIVIFLGDFLMNCPKQDIHKRVKYILHKLNKPNRFHWIRGNHDHVIEQQFQDQIFLDRYLRFKYNDKIYLCQHYGFSPHEYGYDDSWLDKYDDIDVLVHGHTHSKEKTSLITGRNDRYKVQNCVCWDAWNRLVSIDELVGVEG